MSKFKVLSKVEHNLTAYPPDSIIELDPNGVDALELLKVKAIEKVTEAPLEAPEAKPVEKFSAPTSHAEVEKATMAATLAPKRIVKCATCKAERELINVQVFEEKGGTGVIRMTGNCASCGRKISAKVAKSA